MDHEQYGKAINDFKYCFISKDGTVYNHWSGNVLKPDKSGCITIRRKDKRKTLSITRLVAIYWLDMPDDNKHKAYKKDKDGGYGIDNVAWDTIANLNKERLELARQAKAYYNS